jgi:tRNA 2-selenouridine synthase
MLPDTGSIFISPNTFAPWPAERLPIDSFLQSAAGALLLDVRSPGEYNHAHMPVAVSLPLFTDAERAVVGTAYKQQSRQEAIKIGLEYFGPKMRRMVEEVESLVALQAQQQALPENGKAWNRMPLLLARRHAQCSGCLAFRFVWLPGGGAPRGIQAVPPMGAGKTIFSLSIKYIGRLHRFRENRLAARTGTPWRNRHRPGSVGGAQGSAFGNIGLPPQPSQEHFENKLAIALHAKTPVRDATGNFFKSPYPLWVEDESQRIAPSISPILFGTLCVMHRSIFLTSRSKNGCSTW